ncbi:SPJ_0845 family protein [Lacticaseibacillus paracasei]|uniref:SPJ_0845 family protein n=1 Tax=Lacticaseibacillus paracasei TaxID=1597 RepID=UPI002FFD0CBB
MALKINTQTNLNAMFDKFASLPGDKENATGPDPKHHDKLAKKAKEKTEKEAKK